MPELINDYLILLWVAVSILSTGIAFCSRFTRLGGIELLGYGAGAGVLVHGVWGLLIAIDRSLRHYVGILAICCAVLALGYLIRRRIWREMAAALGRPMRLALMLWLLFLIFCVALVRVEIRWPAVLPDGLYIFKEHTLNVKIQRMTALPVDNYLPHIVTEFFLRNISFKKEHPLVPNNEVTNRTILMSLVTLPFRAVLSWHQRTQSWLGTYQYVGKTWPKVQSLGDDGSFSHSFIVGMFLNSLMFLGLLVLFKKFEPQEGLRGAALLYVTNPYFIAQTIFTWPKAMAGFFLLLGWNSVRRCHDPKVVGLAAALAYHCHPVSLAVAGGLGLWYGTRAWREKSSLRPAIEYAVVFLLMILPWLVWTRLILHLPGNLLLQNFAPENAAHFFLVSHWDYIWVRIHNVFANLIPISFLVYPFNLENVIYYAMHCPPTAVGLFVFVPAVLEAAGWRKSERPLLLYGMLIPAVIILLVFSVPAYPVLFGWQAMVGTLLFLGVLKTRRDLSPSAYRCLIGAQLVCNLVVLGSRGVLVGAHLW